MQTLQFSTGNQFGTAKQQEISLQLGNALLSTMAADNKTRQQAENYLVTLAGQTGVVQSLLEIATSLNVSLTITLTCNFCEKDASGQAALYLKNFVCNAWNSEIKPTPFGDKENI